MDGRSSVLDEEASRVQTLSGAINGDMTLNVGARFTNGWSGIKTQHSERELSCRQGPLFVAPGRASWRGVIQSVG